MDRFAGAVILAFVLMVASGSAVAADYPARAVTLVVPYPPGGGVDAMARVVAAKLSDALRAQFIVDNRPGAGGTIGTRAVAHQVIE
jgi:tripartite-type tricarboxylate transporter receptor subunit TctC